MSEFQQSRQSEHLIATCRLQVDGMDCASCASTVESALRRLDGVRDVQVDVVGGLVRVGFDQSATSADAFATAIARVGYQVRGRAPQQRPESDTEATAPTHFWRARGRLTIAIAGVTLACAFLLSALEVAMLPTLLLIVSSVAGGWFVVPRGLRAARSGALDMNFLMSVAAAGAWLIGEPNEAAATLFLFGVAELLESMSMDRARHAISALMELSPDEATVVRDGRELRVRADDVAIGETVVVRPGEKIPVDGDVIDGQSPVNQASITGEGMPIEKEPGSKVFAGTLNGNGALRIRSTKDASDTTLARIVHAVEEAQSARAPTQRFVDRFARVYTPVVVLVALLIATVPPLAALGGWETWIYRALATLVVACPCALVISTPVTIMSGLAGAARAGILIKGGAYLEAAGRVTLVAFDKTGTLTRGVPAVTDVVTFDAVSEHTLLQLAAAVDRHSEHPLARAIVEYARVRNVDSSPSLEFEALPGRGARARVDGHLVAVGNLRLARDLGVRHAEAIDVLQRFEKEGKSSVLVMRDDHALGAIAIADQLRSESRSVVQSLAAIGVRRAIMLTGDNTGTAAAVADQLALTAYRAELLPDDKVRAIRELQASGETVAFVGDGVNDAPALAIADVGIAMGAAGTDVALETADIALMADDLSKLPMAIRIARRTLAIVRQNIWFAIGVKVLFLILAVSGWATLWMAVAADMGASLLVVANGLRARRVR